MSGKRFRAKDKLVQKMKRDGLVQQNRTTGEEERLSSRLADVSFGRDRTPDQDGGNRSAPAGKRRKQPRPIQPTAEEAASAVQEPVSAPEAPVPDIPSMRLAADAPLVAAPDSGEELPPTPPVPRRRRGRRNRKKIKRRQVMDHAVNAAKPESNSQPEAPASVDGESGPGQQDTPPDETRVPSAVADNCRPHRRQAEEDTAQSAEESGQPGSQEEAPPPRTDSTPVPASRQDDSQPSRKYQKAVEGADRAERRVEKAREQLPAKRRLSLQPEPDPETGRPRRLHFEREVLPEYRGPSLPARAAGMVKTAAVLELHGKIRKSERENVALEAAHKTELFAEQGLGRALRWQKSRRRAKPYRALRQAEQRAKKMRLRLARQTALRDNPELRQGNSLSRWIQRRRIRRGYAQAAQGAARPPRPLRELPKRVVQAVVRHTAACKLPLVLASLLLLAAVLLSTGLTSCTALFSGLPSVLASASTASEEERYHLYLEALGGAQAYGSPFDFPWLEKVSSPFGYRIHPITGEKKLHRGVDIAAPQGTPIRAAQDGVVVSAGDAGGYGLCVVIEDGQGCQFRYAHCSSLSVSAGQEVTRGEVIAAVGSTGQSTGPHLHLEITLNGECLNPLWLVDSWGQ